MGTKNNPGKYDCFANAEPDEPMFVLLARDPLAPLLVRLWAAMRGIMDGGSSKCEEALACSEAMLEWVSKHRPERLQRFAESFLSDAQKEQYDSPVFKWMALSLERMGVTSKVVRGSTRPSREP